MKIISLRLTNFRSHEKSDFQFDRYSFVIGPNGAGKTSVTQAINWLITGSCEVTDQSGKGADDLLRSGETACAVEAEVVVEPIGPVKIKRSKMQGMAAVLTVTTHKNVLSGASARDWMTAHLPPMPVLQAVLSASNFASLKPSEQKKLLAQVLADEGIPVPAELDLDVKIATIDYLDALYKSAFDSRTLVNRDLKRLANIQEPDGKMAPVKDIQTRIDALVKERDAAMTAKNTAMQGPQRVEHRRAEIGRSIKKLREEMDMAETSLRRQREAVKIQIDALIPLTMEEEKRLKTVVDAAPKESKTEYIGQQIREQLKTADRIISLGSKAECPICTRSLTKADATKLVDIIRAHVKTLQETLQRAETDDEKIRVAAEAQNQINHSITVAFEKEQMQKQLADIPEHANVNDQDAEIKGLEAELATLTGQAVDTTELDAKIAELDGRIAKGQERLADAGAAAEKVRQYKSDVAERDRLQERLGKIEEIIAWAGPDGARKQAAGDKLGPFTEKLNAALAHFDFSVELTLDPFAMSVGGMQIHQLSESELFRFSVAFQIALAQVTGVGLVVIDRADMLLKPLRRQLTAMLMDAEIEQAIVCSSSEDAPPANPPEGVAFFQLQKNEAGVTVVGEAVSA